MSRRRPLPGFLSVFSDGFDGGGVELEEAMQCDLSIECADHYKPVARRSLWQEYFRVTNKTTQLFCWSCEGK
jgi:hypothetical protein